LEDQLGLVPGTKLKIEDGSDTGTSAATTEGSGQAEPAGEACADDGR
jgi:hypothetical protein